MGRRRWGGVGMWSSVLMRRGGSGGKCGGREEEEFSPPNTVRCSCSAGRSGSASPPAGCASAGDVPPAGEGHLGCLPRKGEVPEAGGGEIQAKRQVPSEKTCTWPKRRAADLALSEGSAHRQAHTSSLPRSRRHVSQVPGRGERQVEGTCQKPLDHLTCCEL